MHEVQKTWWWSSGQAFYDHSVVFLDVAGANDYLYDPSFPPAGGNPATVTYPGGDGYKTYDGDDNFMTNYFETGCPYLFGPIDVQWQEEKEELHIHTNDFDNEGAEPDDIKFYWNDLGGTWK